MFCFSMIGYSQTGIGAYSVHDGGFENHTTTLAGGSATNANLSTALWTASTTANVVRTLSSTGGRSGKYVSMGSTNGTLKNFYSPQIAGAFSPNTSYQIQFWYKSTSTTALDASTVDLFVNNTSATQVVPIGTKQSVNVGLTTNVATWTKVAVAITTNATAAGNFGVAGLTIDAATAGYTADIDDFVVYQASSADNSAPNSPGTITANGAINGGANLSWVSATGGVDGGGYVVVRYAGSAPLSTDDPNQNGIYKFNSTVGAGVVRYIGSTNSFSDTSLSPGVDYYYKVYTVDKAFNYSSENTTSAVQALATTYYYKGTGSLTDILNWGTNTDGTGTSAANFTDVSQLFEIRNTTTVSLDGTWTVGTDPANGTKVRLGNTDQPAITLTLNSGASIGPSGTGNLDVLTPSSGNQTVIYKNTSAISFGNIFDNNLAVIYDGVTISSTTTKNFGTISLINTANVTFTATPVIKNINVDSSSTLVAPTSASTAYITIPIGGSVTINGTVRIPKLTGFVSSNVGTAGDSFGDIQFIGTENLTLGTNSVVEYNRNAAGVQTITARSDYKSVIFSGTTPKSLNGPTIISGMLTINQTAPVTSVTLNGDLTVNGTLSFLSGKITTSNNTLSIGTSGNIAGAGAATGWIIGNLRKQTSSGSSPSFVYAIGDANNYTPVVLTFSGNTNIAGSLTTFTTAGDHASINNSLIINSKSVNRTWSLTNNLLSNFGSYSAIFNYTNGDNDGGVNTANYKVGLFNGSSWSYLPTSNTSNTTSTASSIASFGDFAIGEFIGAPIVTDQSFCNSATVSNLVATGASIKWYNSPSSTTALPNTTTLITGTYYATQTINTAESDKAAVEVTIFKNPTSGGIIDGNQTLCTPANPSTLNNITLPSGHVGTLEYKWQSSTNNVDFNDIAGANTNAYNPPSGLTETTYYKRLSRVSCQSDWSGAVSSNALTITVIPVSDAGVASGTITICSGSAATINLANNVGTIQWQNRIPSSSVWNDITGETAATLNTGSLTASTYFRANVTNGVCSTDYSNLISITVNQPSDAGIASGSISVCSGSGANVSLTGSLGTIQWQFSANGSTGWSTIGDATSSFLNTGNLTATTYYRALVSNGVCSFDTSNSVIITVITTPSPTAVAQTLPLTSTVANLVATGSGLKWYAAATGGSTLPANTSLVQGTYYVSQTLNGCESANRAASFVTLFGIPLTKITSSQCGTTLTSLNSQVAANALTGYQAYRFEVSSGAFLSSIEVNKYNFSLTQIMGISYNTTYAIRVAIKMNGIWGSYGDSCNITTPLLSIASIPVTKMRANQCGSTLATIGSPIHSELVYGATAYRFEVTQGTTVTTVESPIYYFFLTNTAIGSFGTTYSVKIAAKIAGTWGNYGVACTVSTPALTSSAIPTTSVASAFCGTILAALNTKIGANIVYNASGYRFEITKGAIITVYDSDLYNFKLADAGVLVANNTTYFIRVAAKIGSIYGIYGPSCIINTPDNASTSKISEENIIPANSNFDVKLYPNPYTSSFKLNLNSSEKELVEIIVYDRLGRQIEKRQIADSDSNNLEFGSNYPSGIYNIMVLQKSEIKILRAVKR